MRKPRAKKTGVAPAGSAVKYDLITSIAELQAKAAPGEVKVERIIRQEGKDSGITLIGRRLLPTEVQDLKILLAKALPPELPPLKTGDPVRYDFRDPKYIEEKNTNERLARAYGLCVAFPIFGDELKKSTGKSAFTPEEAKKFIESLSVEDGLLDTAYAELTKEVILVDWDRVLFFSGSKSQKS